MKKPDRLNQELTRKRIIELREKHGYSQGQLVKLMGVSRTYYNGIENGKRKITELYVKTLADFYHLNVGDIAVFSQSYDEGFYQGMKVKEKLMSSEFDSMSMKIYQLGKELQTGKKYMSTLYPALKAMGYVIEVVDVQDCDSAKIPPEILETVTDGKLFVLKKGNKTVGYWSPSDFYSYEKYLTASIKGYIRELAESSDKAKENESDTVIAFSGGEKIVFHKKKTFFKVKKPDVSFRVQTPEENYSVKRQLEELKSTLDGYSEMLNGNNDENGQ